MRRRLRFGLTISILGAGHLAGAQPLLYDVRVEEARRRMASGDTVPYSLFVPVARASLSPPPWPAVVLTHGFARDRRFHAENALHMAERGIIVLTPNLVGGLGSRRGRVRNIENTGDHVRWLIARSATPGNALSGLVDPVRIGLAGHSAGGAVSFEAALRLSKSATPAEALLLLDGVPWSRTTARASELPPMDFASLRSEPSACNAFASILGLQDRLRFPADDARILGGTHCDPENPTDALCKLACGGASAVAQSRYQRLMYLFFHDALRAPLPESQSFREALEELVLSGAIEVDSFGPPVSVRLFVNGSHCNGIVDTEGPTACHRRRVRPTDGPSCKLVFRAARVRPAALGDPGRVERYAGPHSSARARSARRYRLGGYRPVFRDVGDFLPRPGRRGRGSIPRPGLRHRDSPHTRGAVTTRTRHRCRTGQDGKSRRIIARRADAPRRTRASCRLLGRLR